MGCQHRLKPAQTLFLVLIGDVPVCAKLVKRNTWVNTLKSPQLSLKCMCVREMIFWKTRINTNVTITQGLHWNWQYFLVIVNNITVLMGLLVFEKIWFNSWMLQNVDFNYYLILIWYQHTLTIKYAEWDMVLLSWDAN